jgi:benzoate-CoA ligase family protein
MAEPARPRGLRGNVVDYLLEHCTQPETADHPYLVGRERAWSFAALAERRARIGNLMLQGGVTVGDRVMFAVRDGIDFPAIFLAGIQIGAVSVPINTFLTAKDYAYYIRDSGAKVMIVDHALAPMIAEIVRGMPITLYVAGGDATGLPSLDAAIAAQPAHLATCARAPDDPAFWLYSSGSTGAPKGVVHSHDHIYWATELFGIGTQGITADDVILCPPKMFFAFGLGNQVYFPLRAGAQVVAEPEPARAETVLASLVAHRPTIVVAVPTLYAGLVNLMRAMEREAVRRACARLRLCVSGGEVLAPSLLRAWQELTGVEILDGVGTTEMTHMFLINRPGEVVAGSCGRLVDGYSARIVDEGWQDVPEGEVGNLFVAGPTAARSYWNKPEKTAATMRDGGVLTGDKVRRDAAGNYFYVGRNDDMLRVGGIWVSPAEIEAALAEHDAVLECAVVGVPDENRLVKPKAFVVLRPGATASAALGEEMRTALRQRLAHFKCPRWIEFAPTLPKTATGKIQRFKLREIAATALAS